jgi:hypothetical protein
MLLEETYEAAERLKRSFDGGALAIDECTEMAETAREDLDCIFNTHGVAALVGNTPRCTCRQYIWSCEGRPRVRDRRGDTGLADLEAKERERCATSQGMRLLLASPSALCG